MQNINQLSYAALGEEYFRKGELIFINKAVESEKPHLHCHNFLEIAYVAEGEGKHSIGNSSYEVSKGDLILINYDIAHEFRSFEDKPPLVVYNCVFMPQFIDYSLINCSDFADISHHFLFRSLFPEEAGQQSHIKVSGQDYDILETLYNKMLKEYEGRSKGYIEILRAYTIELLVTLFRLYDTREILNDKANKARREIIEKTMHYLKDNYQKNVSLDNLSEISFLSPNYLCRMFKEVTSRTISEYIQILRINKACELLKNTDHTILNISYEVGYKDIKFFGKVFKKNIGCTPSEYRKTKQMPENYP